MDFRDIPSSMYECLLEGYLPELRDPESNIIAAVKELVDIQSIASLKGYVQLTPLEKDLRSSK